MNAALCDHRSYPDRDRRSTNSIASRDSLDGAVWKVWILPSGRGVFRAAASIILAYRIHFPATKVVCSGRRATAFSRSEAVRWIADPIGGGVRLASG